MVVIRFKAPSDWSTTATTVVCKAVKREARAASVTELAGKRSKMPGKRSKVWLYYTSVSPGISKCLKCGKMILAKTGNTSNMIKH